MSIPMIASANERLSSVMKFARITCETVFWRNPVRHPAKRRSLFLAEQRALGDVHDQVGDPMAGLA
ncbi:hypothetical protein Pla52n_54910 [Stieleria varia]|uniref:Uncharacterized protein n=1 Tax=Stieleria varia TaxID=2528005 RepID=A0A5C6A5L2_9BACT|nr:hypothetical protein Pla52n_54910 [Stieleria varia]